MPPSASATLFTYAELCDATDQFSPERRLGGDVYSALLPPECDGDGGLRCVVKRLRTPPHCPPERLLDSLATAGRVRHPNLLPLLGVCVGRGAESGGEGAAAEEERPPGAPLPGCTCLVQPFREGRNLGERLWHKGGEDESVVVWPLTVNERCSAVLGAAKALTALHGAGVAHGRLRSSSILLDECGEGIFGIRSLLGGAGLPPPYLELTPEEAAVDGYADPDSNVRTADPEFAFETSQGGWLADARQPVDVFAFGVVLWEIITSSPPWSESEGLLWQRCRRFRAAKRGRSIFDGHAHWPPATVEQLAQLATRCTAPQSGDRPDVFEVSNELQSLFDSLKRHSPPAPASAASSFPSRSPPLSSSSSSSSSHSRSSSNSHSSRSRSRSTSSSRSRSNSSSRSSADDISDTAPLSVSDDRDPPAAPPAPPTLAVRIAHAALSTLERPAAAAAAAAAAARGAAAAVRSARALLFDSNSAVSNSNAVRTGVDNTDAQSEFTDFTDGGTEADTEGQSMTEVGSMIERERELEQLLFDSNAFDLAVEAAADAAAFFLGKDMKAAAAIAEALETVGQLANSLDDGVRIEHDSIEVQTAFTPLLKLVSNGRPAAARAAAALAYRTLFDSNKIDALSSNSGRDAVISSLLSLIQKGGSNAEAAVRALASVCVRPSLALQAAQSNATTVIECLVSLLWGGAEDAKISAASALRSLAALPDSHGFRTSLFEFGAIPGLVRLLKASASNNGGEGVEHSAWAIALLCSGGENAADRQAAVGNDRTAIPSLIRLCDLGGPKEAEAAAAAIAALAGNGRVAQNAIAQHGAISILISLMARDEGAAAEQCVCALRALCGSNRTLSQQLALSLSVRGAFARLLRRGSAGARENCARCCEMLVIAENEMSAGLGDVTFGGVTGTHVDGTNAASTSILVPPLVFCLNPSLPLSLRTAAACALWRCVTTAHTQQLAQRFDAVRRVTALLNTEGPAEAAAGSLLEQRKLAQVAALTEATYSAAVFAEQLMLAQAAATEARTAAALCLWRLCASNDSLGAEAIRTGCSAALVALIRSMVESEAEAGAAAVWSIAGYARAPLVLFDSGIIPPLIPILRGAPGSGVAAKAAWAVRNLCEDDDVRYAFCSASGGVGGLVLVLRYGSRDGREGAARAIRTICSGHGAAANRAAAASKGAIEALCEFLIDSIEDSKGREAAAGALAALAVSGSPELVADTEALRTLIEMMIAQSASEAAAACEALAALAWNADCQNALIEAGAVERLVQLMGLIRESGLSSTPLFFAVQALESLTLDSKLARVRAVAAAAVANGAPLVLLARLSRRAYAKDITENPGKIALTEKRTGEAAETTLRSLAAVDSATAVRVQRARAAAAEAVAGGVALAPTASSNGVRIRIGGSLAVAAAATAVFGAAGAAAATVLVFWAAAPVRTALFERIKAELERGGGAGEAEEAAMPTAAAAGGNERE